MNRGVICFCYCRSLLGVFFSTPSLPYIRLRFGKTGHIVVIPKQLTFLELIQTIESELLISTISNQGYLTSFS